MITATLPSPVTLLMLLGMPVAVKMWKTPVRFSLMGRGMTVLPSVGMALATGLIATIVLTGCDPAVLWPPDGQPPNSDDIPAEYVGAAACAACHQAPGALHAQHGHSHALKVIEGLAPDYPTMSGSGAVANPPAGFNWSDISLVIGGSAKSALFVDAQGFLLTDGTAGTLTQYNLANPPALLPAAFVPFKPQQVAPHPFGEECFRCHTTGPESLATNGGRRQGNLPGIGGTWSQTGVQCEACHGPGSRHLVDPAAGKLTVDSSGGICATCHVNQDEPSEITVEGRCIVGRQQYAELAASPHRGFSCTFCHNPHASILRDRENGLRNACANCHLDFDMAAHEGNVFQWGDYVEALRCESCHMPLVASNASCRDVELPRGEIVSIGDTRSHLVHIDTSALDPTDMLSADGMRVRLDEQGKASVPVCCVCQRCHHGLGNAFTLTAAEAGEIGRRLHITETTKAATAGIYRN